MMTTTHDVATFTELIDELREILLDGTIDHVDPEDRYNRSAAALNKATLATFNKFASTLRVSGYQASWAALKFYGDAMHIDGGFMVVKLHDALYPQYDLPRQVRDYIAENKAWLAEQAQKLLEKYEADPVLTADDGETFPAVHPSVVAHWRELVAAVLG